MALGLTSPAFQEGDIISEIIGILPEVLGLSQ